MRTTATALLAALAAIAIALLAGHTAAGASSRTLAGTLGDPLTHRAGHWPVVYVENHAPGWRVAASAKAWRAEGMRPGQCRTGAACVVVEAGDYGPSGWLAKTARQTDREFTSTVMVNTYRGYSNATRADRALRLQATTHELGHVLGLDHYAGARHGVMQRVADGHNPRPSAADRALLARLYGMTR